MAFISISSLLLTIYTVRESQNFNNKPAEKSVLKYAILFFANKGLIK
jgi:hypothetical protein